MSTSTYIHIFGDSKITIWGLTGQERLQRMLKTHEHITLVDDVEKIPASANALFLNANFLFDARVLAALLRLDQRIALYNEEGCPAAIRADGNYAPRLLRNLNNNKSQNYKFALLTLPRISLKDLKIDFQQNLKKKDPPYILPVSEENRSLLEKELFSGSYKGVTDLVTKWVWPLPAYWATHYCVHQGWQPNHVTYLSIVLAILTGLAFWSGFFGIGLLMGWFMTFLDTVDGKLARVTVTSSRIGDVMDHGLDIVHPPLWYLAWGMGLAETQTAIPGLEILMGLMFLGYVGGRLCEGTFQLWLAPFDMFIWQKLDSFNRLITARRNPNLLFLSYGWLVDRPDIGLYLVVFWHLVSTSFLAWRVLVAWRTKHAQGALKSWLQDIDPARDREILAVRVFTRPPIDLRKPFPLS
ncbi:CDP-alcohol phosphatidyltransferase family protein [Nitrosomonas supralitoralis]|uniref:CDP-alcohol phosphatidyltransferase n=1 Tax=Nitrosomonas supralitoralis TaxID=2116706 RepID=A0A2P7NYS5_9PROT|nr:CDP-alcohol phosphatidyltransferase family protein [Nitrosomonas supralitoralis]PSJ18614.1 CDP-alcohol phosphatidyltransferase [Nitrosomonas supralitoralis]